MDLDNYCIDQNFGPSFVFDCVSFEPVHEISNNVLCATSKASDQPAHMRSLIRPLCLSLENSMTVKLLTEQHLEFLSLTEGCTGSSESTHVKMPHCWKSHVTAHFIIPLNLSLLTCVLG